MTITIPLNDDSAPVFEGRDRIVCMPCTRAEWQAFMEHSVRLMQGVEAVDRIVRKMRDPDDPGDTAEGLDRLTELLHFVVQSEEAMRTLFVRSAVARRNDHTRGGTVMREVWIKAALPDPLAAALEGGAVAMVVVLKPGEVMTLRDSINLVGSAVVACSRGARTLQQVVETRGTPAPDVAETLRQMIEPLSRAEQLHDTTRQLLARAVFVSGDGEGEETAGKGVVQ